jgi:hypothetical protein
VRRCDKALRRELKAQARADLGRTLVSLLGALNRAKGVAKRDRGADRTEPGAGLVDLPGPGLVPATAPAAGAVNPLSGISPLVQRLMAPPPPAGSPPGDQEDDLSPERARADLDSTLAEVRRQMGQGDQAPGT